MAGTITSQRMSQIEWKYRIIMFAYKIFNFQVNLVHHHFTELDKTMYMKLTPSFIAPQIPKYYNFQGGSGFASQITFKDLWMRNVSNPIVIDQYYCDSRLPCKNQVHCL